MTKASIFVLSALLLMTATACDDKPAPPTSKTANSAHVTPGSHSDWCDEHKVPESQCTQCTKELVAAFKATGDWCEEHGLPESHCKKCNPDLVIKRKSTPTKGER